MAALFLDANGVAKRYVQETGSTWVRAQTDPAAGNICFVAATTAVEVLAAIYRKLRMGAVNLTQAQQAEQVLRQGNRSRVGMTLGGQENPVFFNSLLCRQARIRADFAKLTHVVAEKCLAILHFFLIPTRERLRGKN